MEIIIIKPLVVGKLNLFTGRENDALMHHEPTSGQHFVFVGSLSDVLQLIYHILPIILKAGSSSTVLQLIFTPLSKTIVVFNLFH